LEWRGSGLRGGYGESAEEDTSIHEDQVTARPWDEEDPHDFDLPVQDLVSDGRPWSDIVDKLEAVRSERSFFAEVDDLDDLGIYRLIGERPDIKEDIWKSSGLRRRIFGILLALPRDELRKTSDFTLSDREFLAFARSSDDARERLSQDCEMRLFALENPNPEEEPNPDP
jgi:hypothetical protein